MPTNKHAAIRYRAINNCLTNRAKRRWTLQELLQAVSAHLQSEFGVEFTLSRRTLQEDLRVLRTARPTGYGAPILCRGGYYYYADPEFSIEKSPLRPEELALLNEALSLIRQLPALPHAHLLQSLLHRLGGQAVAPPLIQFEINHAVRGLEWLSPLHQAIVVQQAQYIHYTPFTDPPLRILLHPYLLREWRNRWYVFGRNADNRIWNLALDRIDRIEPAKRVPFIENDLLDPRSWFDDIVGVSKPEGAAPVEVLLEADTPASFYLETKPLHPSQQLLRREGALAVFRLWVIPNHELVGDILAYGKALRVLAPDLVAEMVQVRRGYV